MSTLSPAEAKSRLLRGRWTTEDSALLYGLPDWSNGYFRISDRGTLLVTPDRDPGRAVDVHELIEGLRQRGVHTPVLLRFPGILADRMHALRDAFAKAIEENEYAGKYACVYPVKVNQQKQVVEGVRDIGAPMGFGLEAGSKPELLAVLGMTPGFNEMPIVCNGFKDDEFIETVVLATKLGRNIIPVVEKFSELELLVKQAERYGVRPKIGVRVKISARGAGRWEGSGGARSKFGLFISEVLDAVAYLKRHDMADCLRMLHFHIGSQVCDIRRLKHAVSELAHIYTELRRLGAGIDAIDIGGGLAVDYDGSKSAYESSMNYSVEEYAADVVYRIKSVCDDAGAPHPTIISESGRAMVAYMSLLVFDVMGVSRFDASPMSGDEVRAMLESEEETPQPVLDLLAAREELTDRNLASTFHDAMQARDELMSLFSLGYVSLPLRAAGERLFWEIGAQILQRARALPEMPEDLAALPEILSDIYFCNLSIFQSMPDSWAIDQVFPILPIHRLEEQPTRLGILADITCDSDGKVDNFASRREAKRTLELHAPRKGERYCLAAAMVGAYQEVLGDLHNLLGDTNAAHITLNESGQVVIEEVIRGDSVADTLSYMQVDHKELRRAMRADAERAVRRGVLTVPESRSLLSFYEQGLDGYTYLEESE